MATVTAYKPIDRNGNPSEATIAWGNPKGRGERPFVADVKAADATTDYSVLTTYTLDIASELARGIPHPGIVAFSTQKWAIRLVGDQEGHYVRVTFDDDTDLVETLFEGPHVAESAGIPTVLNVSYRLSACTVAEVITFSGFPFTG